MIILSWLKLSYKRWVNNLQTNMSTKKSKYYRKCVNLVTLMIVLDIKYFIFFMIFESTEDEIIGMYKIYVENQETHNFELWLILTLELNPLTLFDYLKAKKNREPKRRRNNIVTALKFIYVIELFFPTFF
jgi:hypothetical protein